LTFIFAPAKSAAVTTANKITILRILLIPFFVVEVLYYVSTGNEAHRLAALLCFAIAAILDGVDGYIARRYQQWSELGTILDPLADKLLLVSGIVLLTFNEEPFLPRLPLWFGGTIVGRDLILLLGLIVVYITVGKVKIRPRITGKISTVLQMTTVLWALLKLDAGWLYVWSLGAALFTGVSAAFYVWDGVTQLSTSPQSSANPKANE
jgi:CDP-diacylglycerol--glycerol-3-phosphate 3-phosphatidyltransferase